MSRVWSEFTKIRDGRELKFRLQELPEEKYTDMYEMFDIYFVPEESLHKAAGIVNNEKSVQEYKQVALESRKMEEVHLDACYLVHESGETKLVGGSIMALDRKGAAPKIDFKELAEKLETKEIKRLFKAAGHIFNACDVRKKYNLDSYYTGRGICVAKEYRGLGIAEEIIKSRVQVCRHYGVPMTGAWMSSYGTQKAAAKVGWETIYKLKHEELGKVANMTFDPSLPPTCDLMVFKV